ncbi:MAG: UvrD-helicase domain-containing protein [Candidatus Delongbacteria bacterium]|nr:UvrD-helicase domain-containing protein [Candidatus Delongbacteria bacterium]
MNINFSKIFFNNDSSIKQPEVIASSILLIKDMNQSYSIKLSMIKWLKDNGQTTTFLPEIRSIYDHAREITGTGAGKEIREEDFIVLMERCSIEGLPDKFRHKHYRNYKKNLLRFIDQRGLICDKAIEGSVTQDLLKNGLNDEIIKKIVQYINSYDLYFKGQIFDKAIKVADEPENVFSLNFFKEEISCKERKFLSELKAEKIDLISEGKYSSLANIFKEGKKIEVKFEDIDLYISESPLNEAKKIKHLILDQITKSGYSPDDFTIVCSDKDLYTTLNNVFLSLKIPVYSSYSYNGNDISTDILRLLIAALDGDTQKIMNFYNLHLAEEPIAFPDVSQYDLKTLYGKLIPRKKDDPEQSDLKLNFKTIRDSGIRKDKEKRIRDFIKTIDITDDELTVKNGLDRLHFKLKKLKEILNKQLDLDPYQYEDILNKIFGEKIIFSELLEYLYLISSKSAKICPNREQKGVRINMMNEPVSGSRFLIFSGLTQENFLKTGNSIKFLQKENYQKFYNGIFGIQPDDTLIENFRIFTSGDIENVSFFIPQWGDEFIPSTRLDEILSLHDKVIADIKILTDETGYGFENAKELKNREFNYGIKDLLSDRSVLKDIEINEDRSVEQKEQFSITFTGENIESNLSSASRIETFMSCSAKFVHELNLQYNEIESQMPYTKGNFFHDITEKFIRYYKGKELIAESEFNKLLDEFSYRNNISNTMLDYFSEYYFDSIDENHERYRSVFSDLKSKIQTSGIDKHMDDYYTNQMKNNPFGSHMYNKQKYGIINFIARLILQMGPTPAEVTKSFETEVKFCDMVVSTEPLIKIAEGYIDFMFVDIKNRVQIVDIKSTKKFKDFEEEIENYQKVQILLYRKAVLKQMNGTGGVNFNVTPGWRNPECGILKDDYFSANNASGEISSYYLSNESPYFLSCDEEDYSKFLTVLKNRLNDHKKFTSIVNSNCEYCSLGPSCPDNEQSKFEKIPGFVPECKESLPIPEFQHISSGPDGNSRDYILFSGEKDKAIRTTDSVIISAGAGAGKTEVLSSKYIHLLVNETETDIENIVCITFTKKAAGEMQNRIYRKLDEVIQSRLFVAADLGDNIQNYILSDRQIEKLKKCKNKFFDKNLISTFHSFCNDLISRYGFSSKNLENYDIDQSISEDHQVKKEIVTYLKELYQNKFSNVLDNNGIFIKWLDSRHLMYAGDNEGGFIPDLIGLYSEMKLSGKELVMSEWEKPVDKYVKEIELLYQSSAAEYLQMKEEAIELLDSEINRTDDQDEKEKLNGLREKISNDEKFTFKSILSKKKYPDEILRDHLIEFEASKQFKFINGSGIDLDLNDDEWNIKNALLNIIISLDEHISEYKRMKGVLEQNDLHLMLLEMMKDKDLRSELQKQFRHLLVDEFQDTNWLQDKIIEELSSEKNKLFIVGDKKQSIYRFQQCDVQIYEKYLSRYKKLTFTDNFRSSADIVNFNNEIFSEDSENVRDEYKIIEKDERSVAKKKNIHKTPVNFFNIICPKDIRKEDGEKFSINEKNKLIKMSEATFVAETIQKNCKVDEDYGKWAILIRKYTHIGFITEAFRKTGIPYSLILKRDLFKLNEVIEFINILKVGLGVLKPSEIEFIENSEEIFDPQLRSDDILSMIFRIYYSSAYRKYISGFEDAETKLSNIDTLILNLAEMLSDSESNKEKFLTDLDISISNNSAGVVVHNPKAVTIMTVHSAKGLEFDNLILANVDEYDNNMTGLFNYLNQWKNGDNFIDFSMSGYKTVTGESKGNFFLNEYIKDINKEFSTRETANLLYVALTRAKKSLSVIISTKEKENDNNSGSSLVWAKYLREYGENINGQIPGFKFHQLPVTEFDLSSFTQTTENDKIQHNISIEKVHDVSFSFDNDLDSATGIAHKDDEPKHETGSTLALDTGNFIHLFLSKEIDNIFDDGYELNKKLNEFKRMNSDSQGINLKTAENMLKNVITDSNFRSLLKNGKILCEKNVVHITEDRQTQGYIDLLILNDDKVIVLDYKTYLYNFPEEELISKYRKQVEIYADAINDIYPGKTVEKYLYFIGKEKAELNRV